MNYNYPGAPPGYNRPPGYGATPPGMGPPGMGPPGMAPPPGAAAPAPGVPPAAAYNAAPALGGRPGLPPNWPANMPSNMSNINFNAPVIRLGTSQQPRGGPDSGRRDNAPSGARRGLGMDSGPDSGRRDQPAMLVPPTREEIARTIFVGNIPEGVGGDMGMERILATAGKLRRWLRATDANNKPQTFGFAEYEDAQSLETAAEIFKDVHVPIKRQKAKDLKEVKINEGEDTDMKDGEEEEKTETTKLQVMVDEASIRYAAEWSSRRNDDEASVQFRLDSARESLSQVIGSLFNPPNDPQMDYGGDMMQDVQMQDQDGVEVAVINLSAGEDELADIPAEMREIVAAEIAAFRERSNQRDQERLRREEEIEAEERRRNRRSPPPASAPTGPGGANGVPIGPRADRGIQGAPSGPKGSQFPRDYQGGVNFVNGGSMNGGVYVSREDEEDSASDSEIERRRKKKRDTEQDKIFEKQVQKWQKLENKTTASMERTANRNKDQESELQASRDAQATYLKELDDDAETSRRNHMYWGDHSQYIRERQRVLEREVQEDAKDRNEEERELAVQQKQKEVARGKADAFLDQQAEELLRTEAPREPKGFKISLGAAAKKIEQAAAPRRTAADIENLLEDEEVADQPGSKKRTLIPINFDAAVRENLTQEEVEDAQRQLARDIPNSKEGLWEWPVSWEHLLNKHIDKDIRDWANNKVLETLGVQEDMLVDAIVEHLKKHGRPQDLVEDLNMALDEEAESLVKKLWRMVIYYSETEKRGIK